MGDGMSFAGGAVVVDGGFTSDDAACCGVGRMVYAQGVLNAIDDNIDGLHAERRNRRNAERDDDLSQVCKHRGYHQRILGNGAAFANCPYPSKFSGRNRAKSSWIVGRSYGVVNFYGFEVAIRAQIVAEGAGFDPFRAA